MAPLEVGPIYAPGAGPAHPAVQRRAALGQPAARRLPVRPQARVAVDHRRFDWVIGIVLGIVLGLAVAAGFVFIGSEDTVDAPRIHGIDTGTPAAGADSGSPPAEPEKLPAE